MPTVRAGSFGTPQMSRRPRIRPPKTEISTDSVAKEGGGELTRPPERAEAMESAMLGFSATCSGTNQELEGVQIGAAARRGRLTIRTVGAMGTGGRRSSPLGAGEEWEPGGSRRGV